MKLVEVNYETCRGALFSGGFESGASFDLWKIAQTKLVLDENFRIF